MLRSQSRQVGMGVGYWSVVTQTSFLAFKKDWLVPTRLVPCHLNRPPCIVSLLEPNIGAFTPIFSKKNVKAFFPQLDSKGQHWEKGEIQQLTKNCAVKKLSTAAHNLFRLIGRRPHQNLSIHQNQFCTLEQQLFPDFSKF